jgi:hypothetical protein
LYRGWNSKRSRYHPKWNGGTIVAWYDGRSGTNYNIYAQMIDSLGLLGGGDFRFYTSDLDGNPKSTFLPGELIQFKASWTIPAPNQQGTYSAEAAMILNSFSLFQQTALTYQVMQ